MEKVILIALISIISVNCQDVKTFQLQNSKTGLFLDSNFEFNVYTHPLNFGDHQKWIRTKVGENVYTFQNKATSFFLDSDHSGGVYSHLGNGGDHQRWIMIGSNPMALKNVATGLVLQTGDVQNVFASSQLANERTQTWIGIPTQ